MTQPHYQAAIAAFDSQRVRSNQEMLMAIPIQGIAYAQRMSEMQQRYAPEASEAVKLAVGANTFSAGNPAQQLSQGQTRICCGVLACYKFSCELAGNS